MFGEIKMFNFLDELNSPVIPGIPPVSMATG